MRPGAPLIILAAILAASCSEPAQMERFIHSADAEGGVYTYDVDMTDSTATYDFIIYTRVDGEPEALASAGYLPLYITFQSPSGHEATEKVFLPLFSDSGNYYSRQIITPYRTGFIPFETGQWQIRILPGADMRGATGLGLRYTIRHGTR